MMYEGESDIEIIMPVNIKKYHGTIYINKCDKFITGFINLDNKRITKQFDNYHDAFEYIKQLNYEECNKRVKNIIYRTITRTSETYECQMASGKRFLFDKEDIVLVQSYNWVDTGYASRVIKKPKTISFHASIIENKSKNMDRDHINRNRYDNRRINLRIVPHNVNVINKDIIKNNKSGITGVRFDRGSWKASWMDNNKRKSKSYAISIYGDDAKRMAIEYREEAIKLVDSYKEALCL